MWGFFPSEARNISVGFTSPTPRDKQSTVLRRDRVAKIQPFRRFTSSAQRSTALEYFSDGKSGSLVAVALPSRRIVDDATRAVEGDGRFGMGAWMSALPSLRRLI